jgi:hypothetical protein
MVIIVCALMAAARIHVVLVTPVTARVTYTPSHSTSIHVSYYFLHNLSAILRNPVVFSMDPTSSLWTWMYILFFILDIAGRRPHIAQRWDENTVVKDQPLDAMPRGSPRWGKIKTRKRKGVKLIFFPRVEHK